MRLKALQALFVFVLIVISINCFSMEQNYSEITKYFELFENNRLKTQDSLIQVELWTHKQIISENWIYNSNSAHLQMMNNIDYGYLLWINQLGNENQKYRSYYMTESGGNKIAVIPELNIMVEITSTLYGSGNAHKQIETILNEHKTPAKISKLSN